ncbi:MAG: UvrD-helicase domain-containing protein [Candidatus Brocadiae bacterium]|nr:UvrD-helicase domain-containing protein [Candidatus Brocadiia bacterium]
MPRRKRTGDILADLTDSQREAVCYGEGPLLVVAGAGTGKTRVIIRRIASLLDRGVPPDRVVAMTFTNKAADEMRRRVEALVGKDVYVSTFHSFCARLLRTEIAHIGRDPSFTICDRADSVRIIRRIVKDRELDPATFAPRDILAYVAVRKDRIRSPQDCAEQAIGIVERTFADVYGRYEEALAANNALDFDDLLLKTLEVFRRRPEVLQEYQNAYLHVLVDEYQDTNLPQHLIARALQGKHRNITAVGDPDQMIYSWRGARLENLMEFEEDFPGAHVVTLERNYRSSANILRAASACIQRNVFRREKTLLTEREAGERIVAGEFADSFAEGRWVAEKVNELMDGGLRPADIAVFYRTKQQSLPLEDAFAALALPHQVVDSIGFFERREIKDVRAYLQLLVNPRDNQSCLRIINTPRRGIGARTVAKLQAEAQRRKQCLIEVVRDGAELDWLGPRAKNAVTSFWQLYERLSSLKRATVAELIRKLLDATDYVGRQPAEERADAQEIVDLFVGYARQYDRNSPGGGLIGFLQQAVLVSDVDGWNARADAVPFMTLHSAKGLEFDAVFLVGLEEDILPHRRALEEQIQGSEDAALEEERRLFYVGMTRARHRLFITCAHKRVVRGREETVAPSRFLDELPQECLVRDEESVASAGSAQDFARDMDRVLKRKRASLRILDDEGDGELACGVRVSHPGYGDGEIVEVSMLGKRRIVRINFDAHGVMSFLLAGDDAAPA